MLFKRTVQLISVIQLVLGVALIVPGVVPMALNLEPAPGWVDWLFVMAGARSVGFAYGMFLAARQPERYRSWIQAMIGIQAIDWVGTIAYLVAGTVTIAQVTTAAFLPVAFVVVLVRSVPSPPIGEAG